MWRYGVIGNTMDFDSIISDSSSDAATKRGNTQLDFHLDRPFKSWGNDYKLPHLRRYDGMADMMVSKTIGEIRIGSSPIIATIYGGMVELADTTGLSPVALRA